MHSGIPISEKKWLKLLQLKFAHTTASYALHHMQLRLREQVCGE